LEVLSRKDSDKIRTEQGIRRCPTSLFLQSSPPARCPVSESLDTEPNVDPIDSQTL
jgi:hypothetical protein